jgi:hypothetical protein
MPMIWSLSPTSMYQPSFGALCPASNSVHSPMIGSLRSDSDIG